MSALHLLSLKQLVGSPPGTAQNSDNTISEGGKGFHSPVTAYSRTRSGELVNWNDNSCSFTLDEKGNVILSYDNGKPAFLSKHSFPTNVDLVFNSGLHRNSNNAIPL